MCAPEETMASSTRTLMSGVERRSPPTVIQNPLTMSNTDEVKETRMHQICDDADTDEQLQDVPRFISWETKKSGRHRPKRIVRRETEPVYRLRRSGSDVNKPSARRVSAPSLHSSHYDDDNNNNNMLSEVVRPSRKSSNERKSVLSKSQSLAVSGISVVNSTFKPSSSSTNESVKTGMAVRWQTISAFRRQTLSAFEDETIRNVQSTSSTRDSSLALPSTYMNIRFDNKGGAQDTKKIDPIIKPEYTKMRCDISSSSDLTVQTANTTTSKHKKSSAVVAPQDSLKYNDEKDNMFFSIKANGADLVEAALRLSAEKVVTTKLEMTSAIDTAPRGRKATRRRSTAARGA